MHREVRGFTLKGPGLLNVLETQASIGEAFDHKKTKEPPRTNLFRAIWDTGATRTVISSAVVKRCGLKPIGKAQAFTASDVVEVNVYLVCIVLPNKVIFPSLRVIEGRLPGDADILIGMDIITQGDFVITNYEGKTTFSFRMPSMECIDFNPEAKQEKDVDQLEFKLGRNEPCWCGSGKKYKKCHGRS